jgi:Flp pilus assembly protein TadD
MVDTLVRHIGEIEDLKYAGKYEEARKRVESYLLRYADDYRLYEELADISLYEGDLERAETSMEAARRLHPESATGTYLMGYILLSKGHFDEGVSLLERANVLFPNNPEILRNLGWGYTVLGKANKGIILLERALNLAPEDALIMEDLGVALISDGQLSEGEAFLRKAGKEDRIGELKAIMRAV